MFLRVKEPVNLRNRLEKLERTAGIADVGGCPACSRFWNRPAEVGDNANVVPAANVVWRKVVEWSCWNCGEPMRIIVERIRSQRDIEEEAERRSIHGQGKFQ